MIHPNTIFPKKRQTIPHVTLPVDISVSRHRHSHNPIPATSGTPAFLPNDKTIFLHVFVNQTTDHTLNVLACPFLFVFTLFNIFKTINIFPNLLEKIFIFYTSCAFTTTLCLLSFVQVISVTIFLPFVICVVQLTSVGSTVYLS